MPANLTGVTLTAGLPAPQYRHADHLHGDGARRHHLRECRVSIRRPIQLAEWHLGLAHAAARLFDQPDVRLDAVGPAHLHPGGLCPRGGEHAAVQCDGYITYAIQPANLTGVTLTASPRAPQPTGTAITLTAAAQGGIAPANVEYKFVSEYRLTDGTWSAQTLLRDYATTPQCLWTPTLAENYTVVVYARTMGSTEAYNVYGYITYQVK